MNKRCSAGFTLICSASVESVSAIAVDFLSLSNCLSKRGGFSFACLLSDLGLRRNMYRRISLLLALNLGILHGLGFVVFNNVIALASV